MKARYGITLAQYEEMLAEQDGLCLICRQEQKPMLRRGGALSTKLHIDHTVTDDGRLRVRGLLCNLCNVMIGMAQEDPSVLRAAAEYIEER